MSPTPPIFEILALQCSCWDDKKSFESLLCRLSGLTALVNVKIIELANQSRRGLTFTDAERATKRQIYERERGKMEAANHLMFSQLFYERNIKWLTIIFSEANYSTFFTNMPILRLRERLNVGVLIICICSSLQTMKLWV